MEEKADEQRATREALGLPTVGGSSSSSSSANVAKPWPTDAVWTEYAVRKRGFKDTRRGRVEDDPVKASAQIYAGLPLMWSPFLRVEP